jgi:hypothetical protein
MPIEFLTNKELKELTEYQRNAQQCRELLRMGIRFEVSRSGRPLVLRETVRAFFSEGRGKGKGFKAPDLAALERIT